MWTDLLESLNDDEARDAVSDTWFNIGGIITSLTGMIALCTAVYFDSPERFMRDIGPVTCVGISLLGLLAWGLCHRALRMWGRYHMLFLVRSLAGRNAALFLRGVAVALAAELLAAGIICLCLSSALESLSSSVRVSIALLGATASIFFVPPVAIRVFARMQARNCMIDEAPH